MIKYHGTPISPRKVLSGIVSGNNFCISFSDKRDAEFAIQYGQSVMFDSGAYSFFSKGVPYDFEAYQEWVGKFLYHPHWACIPDKMRGTLQEQRELESKWNHQPELSAGIFHYGEPMSRLKELIEKYRRTAIGGHAGLVTTGSPEWEKWMEDMWSVCEQQQRRPWVHMLRAMNEASIGRWPFASADSATWARHHHECGDAWKYLLLQAINCRNPIIELRDSEKEQMLLGFGEIR